MGNDQSTLLGQLLLSYGMVTEAALARALQTQETSAEPLGQILVSAGALSARELEVALRAQARLRGRSGGSLPYILVIDDDPEIGALLGDILSGAGYSAGVAQDAPEAIATLKARDRARPALVVLDLGLPRVSGLTLLSQLREMGCRTPVIVLTGNPDLEDEVRGQGLEISRFMVKPVSARTLLEAVESAIRGTVPAGT